MCLAIPGKVVSIRNGEAIVEINGQKQAVLAKDIHIQPEDYVLVQFGMVIEKISKEDADETISAMKNSQEQ